MWEKIRSSLKHYYIDMDMSLEDSIQKITSDHDFHATEQMYKKRLKTWGLSKQIKASDKDIALATILFNEPLKSDIANIRHDKLIRYAKSRVKAGSLDRRQLGRLMQPRIAIGEHRHISDFTPPPQSIHAPDQWAEFDLFLRGMRSVIQKERAEWLSGQQSSPEAIFVALSRGLYLWRNDNFSAARQLFGQAANQTMADMRGTEVSRIAFCISFIVWGTEREMVFLRFAEFMVNAALEVLGPDNPLSVVLRHIHKEQSLEAQVRIWACALDDYQVTEKNLEHWWNMAQRRYRWCKRSGLFDLAAQNCRHAIQEVQQVGLLTPEMELSAYQDLYSILESSQIQSPTDLTDTSTSIPSSIADEASPKDMS